MGGAVRVVRNDYFLGSHIRMHVEDTVLFGDGHTKIIYLQRQYTLTNEGFNTFKPLLMVNNTLVEKVKEIKEKVLAWLKEEAFSPEDVADPNAFFNFNIKVAGSPLHVVQSVRNIDSVFVGANLVLTPAQLDLLKNNMDKKKRQEFFWDLRLALVKNNQLGDFEIKPNPPDDIREVFISSKRIFYDALTKDRLIDSISSVYKSVMTTIWMLERYAGVAPQKKKQSHFPDDVI